VGYCHVTGGDRIRFQISIWRSTGGSAAIALF